MDLRLGTPKNRSDYMIVPACIILDIISQRYFTYVLCQGKQENISIIPLVKKKRLLLWRQLTFFTEFVSDSRPKSGIESWKPVTYVGLPSHSEANLISFLKNFNLQTLTKLSFHLACVIIFEKVVNNSSGRTKKLTSYTIIIS